MRWFLALALVLHFTGLPAVGGVACSAAASGEHSCCQTQSSTRSGDRVSSHCGCAMVPNGSGEDRRPLGIATESRDADTAGVSSGLAVIGVSARAAVAVREVVPPQTTVLAFLSGAGFRC